MRKGCALIFAVIKCGEHRCAELANLFLPHFERANEVDLEAALISRDERQNYGEDRYVALCHLDKRMHVLCFTETIRGIRVISFRKANKREVLHYEKKQATD